MTNNCESFITKDEPRMGVHVYTDSHAPIRESIGTYGEKSMHRELKWWIEPSSEFHEIQVGKYIADIKNSAGITEIQTQSFYKLRNKLEAFLPEHAVTLVYPLVHEKRIFTIDKESGAIIRSRLSPKRGNFYASFWELYQIKQYLSNENLSLRLLLLDVSERRFEANRRKRYHKVDTTIRSLYDELKIECGIEYGKDYLKLIPSNLADPFTTSAYALSTGVNKRIAGAALNVLLHVGAVQRTGKAGRAYQYARRSG